MKVGVIDSGIGGLTVLKALIDQCPKHSYIYYGDTIHLPYGDKSIEEIIGYANKIIKYLESKKVDVIVIACGTLSSHKELLVSNKVLIDVISPLKGKLDKYHKISIIATSNSVKTNAFQRYIKSELELIAAPKLVKLIENNEKELLDIEVKDYLKEVSGDALLLGCTHYAIVKDIFAKYYHKEIICLNDFIKDEVMNLKEGHSQLEIYFSLLNEQIIKNTKRILKQDNLKIERVKLDD